MEKDPVIITGGGRGIGFETTLRFSRNPKYTPIFVIDKDKSIHSRFPNAEFTQIVPIQADMRDPKRVSQIIETILAGSGKIEVVVCNHGVVSAGRIDTYSDQYGNPRPELTELYETNLYSHLNLMDQVIKPMRNQGHGVIITVTSSKEYVRDPYHQAYADIKAELTRETLHRFEQEKDYGIKIFVVKPGNTKTPIDHGVWTPGNDELEMLASQRLHNWYRNTFGNDPKNVAQVIYEIAEGKIDNNEVLVGLDAKLTAILHDNLPYWDKIFNLGYRSALAIVKLGIILRKSN